jgi:hypothetical protein
MMQHAGFAADEAIGWLRIVRPGSVIGPQQEYLKDCHASAAARATLLEGATAADGVPQPSPSAAADHSAAAAQNLAAQVRSVVEQEGLPPPPPCPPFAFLPGTGPTCPQSSA